MDLFLAFNYINTSYTTRGGKSSLAEVQCKCSTITATQQQQQRMDVNTTDPYEQKLYNMFKSFDTQSIGTLDKAALLELCTTLELKDRTNKLVANLIDPKRNNRVTFNEFKEGLLNLLGTDDNDDNATHGKKHILSRRRKIENETTWFSGLALTN